jgi:hypothetical protein
MFNNLPIIKTESINNLVESELTALEGRASKLLTELEKENPALAQAINSIAHLTAEKTYTDSYWKQKVESKFIYVIIAILDIVDKSLASEELKEPLTQ